MVKKILIAFVLAACLVLGGCTATPVSSSGSSSSPLSSEESSAISQALSSASSQSSLPEADPGQTDDTDAEFDDNIPPAPAQIISVYRLPADGSDDATKIYTLTSEQQTKLAEVMRLSEWEPATDLPAMGFRAELFFTEAAQTWYINEFGEKALIVPAIPKEDGEKICYYAPVEIITSVIEYLETLTPDPAS